MTYTHTCTYTPALTSLLHSIERESHHDRSIDRFGIRKQIHTAPSFNHSQNAHTDPKDQAPPPPRRQNHLIRTLGIQTPASPTIPTIRQCRSDSSDVTPTLTTRATKGPQTRRIGCPICTQDMHSHTHATQRSNIQPGKKVTDRQLLQKSIQCTSPTVNSCSRHVGCVAELAESIKNG